MLRCVFVLLLVLLHVTSTPSAPTSKDPLCVVPNWPKNSWIHLKGRQVGDTLTYHCDEGYWNPGSARRVCQANGTWSGTEGWCKAVLCPNLTDPQDGRILQAEWSYNAIATVVCNEGYIYNRPGKNTLQCQGNNTWGRGIGNCEPVQCPRLPDPPHGHMVQPDRSYLATASVKCDEGYVYDQPDHRTRHCQGDNTWSTNNVGTCQAVQCPRLPDPPHGHMVQPDRSYLATASVKCDEGYMYDQPDHRTRHCQGDNTWSNEDTGTCQADGVRRHLDTLRDFYVRYRANEKLGVLA